MLVGMTPTGLRNNVLDAGVKTLWRNKKEMGGPETGSEFKLSAERNGGDDGVFTKPLFTVFQAPCLIL